MVRVKTKPPKQTIPLAAISTGQVIWIEETRGVDHCAAKELEI